MTQLQPAAPIPDVKDWVWVLERECPECGLSAGRVSQVQLVPALRVAIGHWPAALAAESASTRFEPTRWSAMEYGAHVVDVIELAIERTQMMLGESGVEFENWDQDQTALDDEYFKRTIDDVLATMLRASSEYVALLESVRASEWSHRGVRSNGSEFTILSFSRYILHDMVHHVWDVTGVQASELGIVVGADFSGQRNTGACAGGGAVAHEVHEAGAQTSNAAVDSSAAPVPADAGGNRVRITVPVRWFDLDAYGHVNNSEFFRLLEEARIKAFWTVPGQTARAAKNITVGGAGSDTLTLIAGHRIEYRKPLDYRPQGVEVDLWVTKLGGASAELAYEVYSEDDPDDVAAIESTGGTANAKVRTVYAVATSTMVFVSAATQRPRKLTDAERQAWGDIQGPAPEFRS